MYFRALTRRSVPAFIGSMLFAAAGYLGPAHASADSLRMQADHYFADVQKAYDRIAQSPSALGTNLRMTDRYFVDALKKNQAIHSLIRTNSKGMVVSEVIRGKAPERVYRNVADQRWFSYAKDNLTGYQGVVKDEEQGRYYLFWTVPSLKNGETFVGAVVAKIDLWDCIHRFSADIEEPFLIRLGAVSLYSNKWKGVADYEEQPLSIPGVEEISVRYEKAVAAGVDTAAATVPPEHDTPAAASSTQTAPAARRSGIPALLTDKYVIIGLLVALVALVVAAYWLVEKINFWRTMREIDKSDEL